MLAMAMMLPGVFGLDTMLCEEYDGPVCPRHINIKNSLCDFLVSIEQRRNHHNASRRERSMKLSTHGINTLGKNLLKGVLFGHIASRVDCLDVIAITQRFELFYRFRSCVDDRDAAAELGYGFGACETNTLCPET
jgi:hypothetical protein